jgi:hypothetical protein
VINPSQRPQPDNTQHSQQTNIYAPGGIRTHDLSRQAAEDLRLRPRANRNEYQEYILGGKGGRCIELTTLPPSFADCLEIWEPRPAGTLRACPGL